MENEVVFSNKSVLNRETLTEAQRAYLKSPRMVVINIVLVLLALLMTGMIVRDSVLLHRLYVSPRFLVLTVVCLAELAYFNFLFPGVTAKQHMRRKQELVGTDELHVKVSFLETEILTQTEEGSETLHLQYDAIKRVQTTKHLIVLITKARQMILLDREGFQNGTEEDFRQFIAQKCPQAKLKR